MKVYRKKKKTERLNFYIDDGLRQHLSRVSEDTGTAVAEIIRQALRTELNTRKYAKYRKDKS